MSEPDDIPVEVHKLVFHSQLNLLLAWKGYLSLAMEDGETYTDQQSQRRPWAIF